MSHISRRNLVQAAALVPFQAVRGTAQNSAIKVGIIGAGSRGSYDGRILSKDPRARVTAVCDISDEQLAKAKSFAPDASQHKDFKEVLAGDVDAVVIATPVFLHPEHFEAAVKSGKHI